METHFSFEFHSLVPISECKTISDASNMTTIRLFGRTENNESVCANITAFSPYFYLWCPDIIQFLESPFGTDTALSKLGIKKNSFRTSLIEKVPFYSFHEGMQKFIKVECCSEPVRKHLINFVKDSPNLFYTLYESHISVTMQFMSDHGIVGMGLVHVQSALFVENLDKISHCDIECSFRACDIFNCELISRLNCSNSLLPSLSIFKENLGISDLNIFKSKKLSEKSEINTKDDSISSIWPNDESSDASLKSKLKSPNFKNYILRDSPPSSITDYIPIIIPEQSQCVEYLNKRSAFEYTPAFDPPTWPDVSQKDERKDFLSEKIVERLTLNSSNQKSLQLYDYNGDFYLKIFILECYDGIISEFAPISTIIFSIICGNQRRTIVYSHKNTILFNSTRYKLKNFESEVDMLNSLISIIILEDPDVLAGFEIDNRSWGHLARRYNLLNEIKKSCFSAAISRVKYIDRTARSDPWIARVSSQFQVQGRISMNLWRIFRDEVSLKSYSLGELCKHYFQINFAEFSTQVLVEMMQVDFENFLKNISSFINQICDLTIKTPFLVKSIEFSRLFGIDLFSTLTRGSQYRVESIMITAAHSENYLLRTPTEADVRVMRAAQGIPLTMEPMSNFYRDPIVVLDFQSLYPSMIIAYNFCYSTIIGKFDDQKVVSCGAVRDPTPSLHNWIDYTELKDYNYYKSPGNIVFIRKETKFGLLPRLLHEILTTRVAIKNAMKTCESKIKSILDARQQALKYISNMTYGYTSASFSGRMPNVDIADAIVLSGRKTLERAIDIVESHPEWEAKVVYGDTDSLFVLLPGRSLNEAFKLGRAMADLVTLNAPSPVALKFEKIYFPSILMSKKRYCGYKYESEGLAPVFDAKGIETIRRDGCTLTSKILEKSLLLLFTRNDISLIKEYVQRQLIKILTYKKTNISDFVFSREVRLGTYKSDKISRLPLSAIAAQNRQIRNPRDVIAFGQRVPFVIVSKPFSKLYQQVVDLEEFFNKTYHVDVVYYVTKQVLPALARALSIQGINVFQWYNELPLAQLRHVYNPTNNSMFHRIKSSNEKSETLKVHNFSDHLQACLKLQDLIVQDQKTKTEKLWCCGNLVCQTTSCKKFWDRFNFEHRYTKELISLKKEFDLDY